MTFSACIPRYKTQLASKLCRSTVSNVSSQKSKCDKNRGLPAEALYGDPAVDSGVPGAHLQRNPYHRGLPFPPGCAPASCGEQKSPSPQTIYKVDRISQAHVSKHQLHHNAETVTCAKKKCLVFSRQMFFVFFTITSRLLRLFFFKERNLNITQKLKNKCTVSIIISLNKASAPQKQLFSRKQYVSRSAPRTFLERKFTLFYCKMLTLHLGIIIIMCHLFIFLSFF